MNKRMNRKKFNIGTYYLKPYACTENHVKDLKQCGIDFVVCMQNETFALDLLEKEGIGAIVSGVVPPWWGNRGEHAGTMKETNKLQLYSDAAKKFKDHGAIWGIDCGDEPSSLDFRHCGEIVNLVNEKFKNQFAYLNLYANYGINADNSVSDIAKQLGTASYGEYIQKYCENVNTDYICFDFYPYSASVKSFYENLIIVSDACSAYKKSMWTVLQANSSMPEKCLSENNLRFQAYSAMAFGAECIIWACYCPGWWYNNVLDKSGNKTEMYDKLKTVNNEIKYLANEYIKFTRLKTHFIESNTIKNTAGILENVKSERSVILTELVSKNDNSPAIFLFSSDDPYDVSHGNNTCTFLSNAKSITVISKKGRAIIYPKNNAYCITISSNEAVLLIANY